MDLLRYSGSGCFCHPGAALSIMLWGREQRVAPGVGLA